MADSDLVKDFLYQLRSKFYPDDEKGFYQQRSLLIQSITHPASWLNDRNVRLPEKKLREILNDIMRGVMHFGDTGKIQYFARYYLHVTQQHMKHQGEVYYEQAKGLRTVTETAIDVLTKQQRARLPDAQDETTVRLAELHRLVQATAIRRRKATPTAAEKSAQLDLF